MENFIDKLAWIEIKDKKILSTRSKGKDTYYIPGGKREEIKGKKETDEEALTREIKEELSVDLIPKTIKFLEEFKAQAHGKPEGTIVRMRCYTADYKGKLASASEIEGIVWLNHADKLKSSPVDKLILHWLFQQKMID